MELLLLLWNCAKVDLCLFVIEQGINWENVGHLHTTVKNSTAILSPVNWYNFLCHGKYLINWFPHSKTSTTL